MNTIYNYRNTLMQSAAALLAAALPVLVHAANAGVTFRTLVNKVGNYVSGTVFPILVSIAVLIFFGNMIFFIMNNANEAERTKFKKYSVNSILALFILLSMWGIVGLGTRTLFNTGPVIPQLPVCDDTPEAPCPQ